MAMKKWKWRTVFLAVWIGVTSLTTSCSRESNAPDLGDLDTLTGVRQHNQQQESLALAKSMYVSFLDEGTRVQQSLEELRRFRNTWNTQIESLLDSEDGRFLASEPEGVAVYRNHVATTDVIPEESISHMSTQLDTLLAPIRDAIKNNRVAGTLNPEFESQLAKLDGKIQEALTPLKRAVPAIEAVATNAKVRGTRGTQTLREVIDKIEQTEAQVRAEEIAKVRAAAEEEATNLLAEQEASLIRAKAEKERLEMELEEDRLRAEMAEEKLRARANNLDTLEQLKPFVSKGKSLFVCSNASSFRWSNSSWNGDRAPAPMSLAALTCAGALKDSKEGRQVLYDLATARDNDRPAWDTSTDSIDWDKVRENQVLLRELGHTLVEEGHLLP